MTPRRALAAMAVALGLGASDGNASETRDPAAFGAALCGRLSEAVAALAPSGDPVWVASYRPGPDESAVPAPLRTSAFVYDNALAAIALVACGDLRRARQIGDAILSALSTDRTFRDGRLRNAYRAGLSPPTGKALLPGWWDDKAGLWAEDSYQDGTAVGNVAWAALALLTLHDAVRDPRDLAAAGNLLRWIDGHARAGEPGFSGGVDGFDQAQSRLLWASTEHNVDVAAVAEWYVRAGGDPGLARMASSARGFVAAAFVPAIGCFRLGADPDGSPSGTAHLALDTQLWPLLLSRPEASWGAALGCAEGRMGVAGGFDFDNDRDGLWVEGTAQAALVYRALGDRARADALLAGLRQDLAPSGWLYATRADSLTTGLKIGPQSATADFFYFRRPHLGATAWAALAALGWNPLLGRRTD